MAARFATVNPSGGEDYTSFSAAEAGEQAIGANLVSAGDTLEIQAAGTWGATDTTALTINGFTTDATHWILLSTDAANRFDAGAWDTAKAILVASTTGSSIQVSDGYVTIQGLQIENTGTGQVITAQDTTLVDSCFLRGRNGVRLAGTGTANARNTLAMGGSQALRAGFKADASGATIRCHSCEVIGGGTDAAFDAEVVGSTILAINCLASGHSVQCYGGSGTVTQSYCAATDATATGTGAIASATFTFVNAAGGDYRIDASDTSGVIGGGTDLSADASLPVVYDATGTRLRPTAPTMGHWEVNPVSGGAMVADLPMALDVAGTLTGDGALAGDAPMALALSGALSGAGALAGDLPAELALSGELTGAGALAGDVPVALELSGSLTGAGALSGDLPVALDLSGALTGSGAMVADLPGALVLTGTLTALSPDAMVADIPMALVLSGALTGDGTMSGALTGALGLSGALTGTGALQAALEASLAMSGELRGAGALAAGLTGGLVLSGELTNLAGAMTADLPMGLAMTGTLTGLGSMTADMPLRLTLTGGLSGGAGPVAYITGTWGAVQPGVSATWSTVEPGVRATFGSD